MPGAEQKNAQLHRTSFEHWPLHAMVCSKKQKTNKFSSQKHNTNRNNDSAVILESSTITIILDHILIPALAPINLNRHVQVDFEIGPPGCMLLNSRAGNPNVKCQVFPTRAGLPRMWSGISSWRCFEQFNDLREARAVFEPECREKVSAVAEGRLIRRIL